MFSAACCQFRRPITWGRAVLRLLARKWSSVEEQEEAKVLILLSWQTYQGVGCCCADSCYRPPERNLRTHTHTHLHVHLHLQTRVNTWGNKGNDEIAAVAGILISTSSELIQFQFERSFIYRSVGFQPDRQNPGLLMSLEAFASAPVSLR